MLPSKNSNHEKIIAAGLHNGEEPWQGEYGDNNQGGKEDKQIHPLKGSVIKESEQRQESWRRLSA